MWEGYPLGQALTLRSICAMAVGFVGLLFGG